MGVNFPTYIYNIPTRALKSDIEVKTIRVAEASASVGLNVHKAKSKILKYKMEITNPITVYGETLEDVGSFTYLGCIIDERGESNADVKERIGKARIEFLQMKNIWNSKHLLTNISQNLQYERRDSPTVRS
ncbi:unnamed protein product [Schistosoma curassoni]|uniref:Reverse transcriptase domain-containing protein n=1 Tax=Schistosoma curassoni TaxID=6186 RepID=A0A183JXH9_9TREM|nr:unnamed protein product [Schistosoma curassoni]